MNNLNNLNGGSLQLLSFDKEQFKNIFEFSPENIKNPQLIISLNLEKQKEGENFDSSWNKLESLFKDFLNLSFKNIYELKFRSESKKIYIDLIIIDVNLLKKIKDYKFPIDFFRLLSCLFDNLDFDIILKSGIDITQLLNEKLNNEKIIENICSFLFEIKTSKNISFILSNITKSLKEINFNNKYLIEIDNFNATYLENKDTIELPSEEIKKISNGIIFLLIKFKEFLKFLGTFLEYYGLTNLNFDDIKFSFFSPENKKGSSINLKIRNITKVITLLIKEKNKK